jgi:hypothetical protein
LFPRLLIALKVTVQVPDGSVEDPAHVPLRAVSPAAKDRGVVRVVVPFEATALTLLAVSLSVSFPT